MTYETGAVEFSDTLVDLLGLVDDDLIGLLAQTFVPQAGQDQQITDELWDQLFDIGYELFSSDLLTTETITYLDGLLKRDADERKYFDHSHGAQRVQQMKAFSARKLISFAEPAGYCGRLVQPGELRKPVLDSNSIEYLLTSGRDMSAVMNRRGKLEIRLVFKNLILLGSWSDVATNFNLSAATKGAIELKAPFRIEGDASNYMHMGD